MGLTKTLIFFSQVNRLLYVYGENMKSRLKLLDVACAWFWNELWQPWSIPFPWSAGDSPTNSLILYSKGAVELGSGSR